MHLILCNKMSVSCLSIVNFSHHGISICPCRKTFVDCLGDISRDRRHLLVLVIIIRRWPVLVLIRVAAAHAELAVLERNLFTFDFTGLRCAI